MIDTSIRSLWSAQSIAIVGASDREGALSKLPITYLQKYGYQGEIFPINPKGGTISGLKAYTSVSEVGKPIDLALIIVPVGSVISAIKDCAESGVKVATVMGSGFAESGDEGKALQDEIVTIAKNAGMRIVGPNCIGSIGGASKLLATFSPVFSSDATNLAPSGLALVSQSGALGYGTYSLALDRGLPIGVVVTTGNEADVSAMEVATSLAESGEVNGILIYAESITDLGALHEVASKKPTAILKAGRSDAGAKAASSHTGALATSDRVTSAAIKSAGAVRVSDIEELLDAGAIFSINNGKNPPKILSGKKIAVITTSGGSGILAADAIESYGLELATLTTQTRNELDQIIPSYGSSANPVDLTAAVMADQKLFDRALSVLAADPGVDAIVAAFCVLVGSDVEMIAQSLSKISGIPIVVARTGSPSLAPLADKLFGAASIPIFPTPERAVRALSIAWQVSDAGRSPKQSKRDPIVASTREPSPKASEVELKELWRSVGVKVPESFLISDISEVKRAVADVGSRAVLKVVLPGLLHKSDAGGVLLDINESSAEQAFASLIALGDGAKVLVERFVPKGVEALVGITPSPLGRVLTIGVGGVLTEIINDSTLRLLPVTRQDVVEMIHETKLGELIKGVRGAKAGDEQGFIDTVLRITDATMDWESEFELDINPVTILPEGAWVLDSAYLRVE